jgi:hypothetical protein
MSRELSLIRHIVLSTELTSILTARETRSRPCISFLAYSMSLIEYILMMRSALSEGYAYHNPCSLIIYVGCDGTAAAFECNIVLKLVPSSQSQMNLRRDVIVRNIVRLSQKAAVVPKRLRVTRRRHSVTGSR